MTFDPALLLPRQFPSQNAHRLVVYNVEATPDEFCRLESRAADALAAAREAVELAGTTLVGRHRLVRPALDALAEEIARGRILGAEVRALLKEVLDHLPEESEDGTGAGARLRTRLETALAGAQRVADLIAAERDVARHRARDRG